MDTLDLIIALLMASETTILFLGSIILYKGGMYSWGEEHPKSSKTQRYFSLFLLISSILALLTLTNGYLIETPSVFAKNLIDDLCYTPMALIPFQALILQQVDLKARHWISCFGPIAILLIVTILFSKTAPRIHHSASDLVFIYLFAISMHSLFRLREWDALILENFSEIANKQTIWYRRLMLPLLIITALWIPLHFFPDAKWLLVVYYSYSVIIFPNFTVFALKHENFEIHPEILAEFDQEETEKPEPEEVNETPAWAEKLDTLMTRDHLYRKENLNSTEVAAMIPVNRTYLSKYLNDTLHTTFYDYINGFRIAECEKLLMEDSMSISDIATQCGFKDHRAMGHSFHKKHGMTPTEWKRGQVIAR